jgi:hypothetical protein
VSADGPETTADYSKGRVSQAGAEPRAGGAAGLRLGLAGAGLAGAACLAGASVATVLRLTLPASAAGGGAADATSSGLDRHGPALLLVAAFAVALLVPAARGVRAAMAALAAAGLLALGIAVADDVPALDEAGPVTVLGDEAQVSAGPGFYLETLGGTLLVLAGGGLALLPAARPDARTPPEGAAPGPARMVRRRGRGYQR